ncbi:MAG: DUF6458 family protein [Actinomycetota bacterium]
MGIGVGLFLIAIGAILTFAVSEDVALGAIDLNIVGIILMIVGSVGLLLSVLFWSNFSPYRRGDRTVVRERDREVL